MLISICVFSYLFIIPVIFNFSLPQISLIYMPLFIISNYVQISQNLISLLLIPSHKKEKSFLELPGVVLFRHNFYVFTILNT